MDHFPSDRYLVAAIQFEPTFAAKAENIARLLALTDGAARQGARLIVQPEMATSGYCWYDRAEIRPLVEPVPGPTTDQFAELARTHGCYIVVGMPEVDARIGIFYNSAVLIGPEGVVGVYRKTHSYISEPKWAKDGDLGLPVWDTPLGRLGLLICMDVDHPEPARLLALQGADVLCFPTNWLDEKSPSAAWIARAYENGCYLIAANRYGLERGVQFSGGSAIVNPDGTVQSMRDTGDGIVMGEVSLVEARRKSFQLGGPPEKLSARRPEHYENLTLNTYLFNPLIWHGLYGHRPLPPGRRSPIAVVQFGPEPGDIEGNLASIEGQLTEIGDDVDLVVFPEYAVCGPPADPATATALASESVPAWAGTLQEVAHRKNLHIVIGFVEQLEQRLFSSGLLIGPDGIVARYRKTHPIGTERAWCSPGDESPPVIDLPLGRLGLMIGTDLCFPEVTRSLAVEGCDLLLVPAGPGLPAVQGLGATSIPLPKPAITEADRTHAHLARQRAVENNCYLAFASLPAPGGIGHSAVFGPTPGFREGEQVLDGPSSGMLARVIDTTNLDTPYPTSAVRFKEYLSVRRPDLYDLLQLPEPPVHPG